MLLPLPEFPRVHSLHPVEETGEGGDFGEMELVGDLGGEVKVEKHEARALCYDPVEYIKENLKIQEPGVELLHKTPCELREHGARSSWHRGWSARHQG